MFSHTFRTRPAIVSLFMCAGLALTACGTNDAPQPFDAGGDVGGNAGTGEPGKDAGESDAALPEPKCGDGKIDSGEQCDDGDTSAADGCNAECHVENGYACVEAPSKCTKTSAEPECGNGAFEAGEECDDANTKAGDGCSKACKIETGFVCVAAPSDCSKPAAPTVECGNGLIESGEQCDDGAHASGDGCDEDCHVEADYSCVGQPSDCDKPATPTPDCGNGAFEAGEECDDGGKVPGDGCSEICKIESGYICISAPSDCGTTCGDSQIAGDEECDDGNATDDGNGCSATCQRNDQCGNGTVESLFEECDDDNTTDDGNGCSADCERNDDCGNGTIESLFEECDDDNTTDDGNGCDGTCKRNDVCGDTKVQSLYELCDDGNAKDDGNGCDANCQSSNYCGNGVVESAFEECDLGAAGNTGAYGGCKSDCTKAPACGDGNTDTGGGETCDDANTTDDGNGCDASCHKNAVCGNNKLEALYEQCDDGNVTDDANGCGDDCKTNNVCGDGTLASAVEECDLGTADNTGAYNGCNADCTRAKRCGDNHLDTGDGETCDDGNTTDDGNGCDATCHKNNDCGNTTVESAAEQCDDGTNDGSYGTCKPDCTFAGRCGDGSTQVSNELCDDGNTVADPNGCKADCTCKDTCSGVCVELANDKNNCGSCGHACTGSEECVGGECCDHCNLMRGAINGSDKPGNARVVEISGYNGASAYPPANLSATCATGYSPSGVLCDEGGAGLTDSIALSGKTTGNSGATWYGSQINVNATGVLVIDLGAIRTIGSFSVFQMFADSRTQQVRVFSHPRQLGAAPAGTDASWVDASGWRSVGDGALLSTTPNTVGSPLRIVLPAPVTTRFLRVDAKSSGAFYIEFRSIKAFAP